MTANVLMQHFYFSIYFVTIIFVVVNQYELLTLEQSQQGVTEERMILAFQAVDELIPQLGVFSRIFQKLRDDFFGLYFFNCFFQCFHFQSTGFSFQFFPSDTIIFI